MHFFVGLLLLCSTVFGQGIEYKFQRDTYLMNGCPEIQCSGDKIAARCRMPTTYTFRGKTCRGCPRDFCKNNLFGALMTQDASVSTRTNDVYNPLTNKSPGQTPEVFVAMKNAFSNPNYRYTPGDIAAMETNAFLDTPVLPDLFSSQTNAELLPSPASNAVGPATFNPALDFTGNGANPASFGNNLMQGPMDFTGSQNIVGPIPTDSFNGGFDPNNPNSLDAAALDFMMSFENLLAIPLNNAQMQAPFGQDVWSAVPHEQVPVKPAQVQPVVVPQGTKKSGC